MMRISPVWYIRQTDFHIKAFIHAGMIHALHDNLPGSEQLKSVMIPNNSIEAHFCQSGFFSTGALP